MNAGPVPFSDADPITWSDEDFLQVGEEPSEGGGGAGVAEYRHGVGAQVGFPQVGEELAEWGGGRWRGCC